MTGPTPKDAERRLLDYSHMAAYLGVSIRTAKELASRGQVPKVLIGHRVLFDKVDLDLYIQRVKRAS